MSEPKGAALLTPNVALPTITSAVLFLLEAPLYSPHLLIPNEIQVERMLFEYDLKDDGFCPYCHDRTTFKRATSSVYTKQNNADLSERVGFHQFKFECARSKNHVVMTWVHIEGPRNRLQKVGQFPSLADVANDQAKQFSKVLPPLDARELHRAIGLAAHGVGIGSFVYLRRVFERLIKSRFDEHKVAENWTDDDWFKRRMDERVHLMRHHLPEFLVTNSSVYGILSKGIHELDEKTCLAVFEVVKESIIEMLEEDERKRKRVERQSKLTKAVQELGGKL